MNYQISNNQDLFLDILDKHDYIYKKISRYLRKQIVFKIELIFMKFSYNDQMTNEIRTELYRNE